MQITRDKSFYLQCRLKEFRYPKKTKISDQPELSITVARKLATLAKADNVRGKDLLIAAAERAQEKTVGGIVSQHWHN